MHVIGSGGLALARGLTLEGLAVSYALRNVGAADTLLQMGRWFGYRPGYENLCRIHAAEGLIDDFEYVSESVEELRTDFQRMVQLGKTPYVHHPAPGNASVVTWTGHRDALGVIMPIRGTDEPWAAPQWVTSTSAPKAA